MISFTIEVVKSFVLDKVTEVQSNVPSKLAPLINLSSNLINSTLKTMVPRIIAMDTYLFDSRLTKLYLVYYPPPPPLTKWEKIYKVISEITGSISSRFLLGFMILIISLNLVLLAFLLYRT